MCCGGWAGTGAQSQTTGVSAFFLLTNCFLLPPAFASSRSPATQPQPQSVDARDYELAAAKDFVQKRHVRGDDWSRASARPLAEDALDPEVDDVIGGAEGDVLDLAPDDTILRRRAPSHVFGPRGGPSAALALPSRGLQTLSDTELDYGANALDPDGAAASALNPVTLRPNHDFIRKRQGAGGAIPFAKQYLGGSRSKSDGEDSDEDLEFPYLAEGNAPLEPRYGGVEPNPRGTRFALRREEFLAMHARAKEREARRLARAEGDALVLRAADAADALKRHRPAASFAFSGRHDQPDGSDEELDDNEALGLPSLGGARRRGGPGEYEPRYTFKDPHAPVARFGLQSGRPSLDSSDDELEGRADNRDFLGGAFAARNPNRSQTMTPGTDFGRRSGRVDRLAEDKADFPDTHAEGDWLDLNPHQSQTLSAGAVAAAAGRGRVDMLRASGRPEGPDALDIEEMQEGARLDLNPERPRRHVPSSGFARQTGRPETDAIDLELEGPRGPDLHPDASALALAAKAPAARFPSASRFDPSGAEEAQAAEGQSDLDPLHTLTRRRAPAAQFGTAAARAEIAVESNTSEEAAMLVARDHAGRVAPHTPGVDFASGAGPRLPGMGAVAPLQTALQPELGRDFVAGATPSHGFGTAAARAAAAASNQPQLALNPSSPRGSDGGASFPQALRPGAGLQFARQEGSVLHPEDSDPLVNRRAPEWGFDHAKRFGTGSAPAGALDAWLDQPAPQLSLHPSRAGVDPQQPHASFPSAGRFDPSAGALSEEQLLALDTRDDALRTRHPRAIVGTQPRWESAVVSDVEPRPQHLYPSIDATRPDVPRVHLDMSGRAGSVANERAAALGPERDESQTLRLNPRPVLPRSPAAHITSSLRQSDSGAQRGRPGGESYYNTSLRLHPSVEGVSSHPRAPAHTIGERIFDPATYVPSPADIAAARKLRLKQEARAAAAVAAEEDGASLLADAVDGMSLGPSSSSSSGPVARVLGPSRSRSRPVAASLADADADADLSELEQSAASLSLSVDGIENASSSSLGLPDAGVVANAASLLAARRERQAREAARLAAREEARLARRAQRHLEREREHEWQRQQQQQQREQEAPLAPASRVVAAILPGSVQRAVAAESITPAREPSAAAVAGEALSSSSAPASPPSPSQPLRRTVQFALEPQVREYVVERPEPQQPQPQPPRAAQSKQQPAAALQPKPKAISATAAASAQPPPPVRKAKPVALAAAVSVGSRTTAPATAPKRPTSAAPSR